MTEIPGTPLARGDQIPHFRVTGIDGVPVEYGSLWQRRNVVLVALPPGDPEASRRYAAALAARLEEIRSLEAECVLTFDAVSGVPAPGIAIADRWGEICFAAGAAHVAALPSTDEIAAWLAYVQIRCPECEGEWR